MVDIADLAIERVGSVEIGCTEQGLTPTTMSITDAIVWFKSEQTHWGHFRVSPDPTLSSKVNTQVDLAKLYIDKIDGVISSLNSGEFATVEKYFDHASNYNILIAQSALGEAVFSLDDHTVRSVIALSLSRAWRPRRDSDFDLLMVRSTLLASRALIATSDLSSIRIHLSAATENLEHSKALLLSVRDEIDRVTEDHSANAELVTNWLQTTQQQLKDFQLQKVAELDQIRDLYHSKMQTEAAAIYWRNKARAHRWIAWPSLLAFVAMVAAPMAAGWFHFDALKAFLIELTAATADKFSLTPVVALSIPVIGYGWLLRHVSRLFVQNLTLADDASYRRVMSMTFLGLAKDPASGISDAERGIILNALFRPAPPNASDEGPPSGLLDLINPKKSQ